MKFIVPFELWRCANLAKATNDIRHYLNAVHITGKRIEGTNGHVAYIGDFGDFTLCEYLDGEQIGSSEPLIIYPKNKLPANTKGKNIQYVCILVEEQITTIEYIDAFGEVVAMDCANIIDAKYPNIDKLDKALLKEPLSSDPVGVNTAYLSLLHKIEGKQQFPMVKIEFRGYRQALRVEFKKPSNPECNEIMLLMPANLGE